LNERNRLETFENFQNLISTLSQKFSL
jgi:hypothetical protein